MADHEPPGYDDWFDDPEPPTLESGRGNRPSYDIPAETEEDVWVLPEDETRRARRGGRRGDIVIGGRSLTSTQVAILAIAGLAVLIAILAAANVFSSGTASTIPTGASESTQQTKSTTTQTTPTVQVPTKTLQLNDPNHAQVKILQKDLRQLGFLTSPPDGIFGAGTQTAVEQFQQSVGLPADGVAGQQTLAALRRKLLRGG